MVLHISGALDATDVLGSLKLTEDLAVCFPGNVGQHVQTSTVSHRDGDFVETFLGRGLQDFIHHADGGLRSLKAEALLSDVLGLEERFECFGLVQFREDAQLGIVVRLLVGLLHCFLEPASLLGVLNVHVFETNGAAVGIAQHSEDFAQQHRATTTKTTGDELAVKIPEGQTVAFDF